MPEYFHFDPKMQELKSIEKDFDTHRAMVFHRLNEIPKEIRLFEEHKEQILNENSKDNFK